MRRLVLAAVSVLAALAVAGAFAAPPPPSVALAARSPVVVAGAHFFPREWVRVTLNASTLRVRADRAGQFHLTFPDLILSRCAGLRIRAAGTHGTVAALKLPQPECMPARSP